MKIIYFDKFERANSNRFWANAFSSYGTVFMFDIRNNFDKAKEIEADHVHFGGSVKQIIEPMKWWPGVRKTLFNGDGYNFQEFFIDAERFIDQFYCTNKSATRNSRYNFIFCPAPDFYADTEWISVKQHEVTFIGNNYNREREGGLQQIGKRIRLSLFGGVQTQEKLLHFWPQGYGPVDYENYKIVVKNSWITLGDPAGPICKHSNCKRCVLGLPLYVKGLCRQHACQGYESLHSYSSNRLANCLLAGSVHVMPYVCGLEDYFDNWKHLVWYSDIEESVEIIYRLLSDKKLCRQIALKGQERATQLNMTFSGAVKRILYV
jgi:hypothetical protein